MTNPLYPSLIPRYVDESWFANDQPVDEAAKLNELEANHEVWMRGGDINVHRNIDVHTPHIEAIDDDDGNEEEEDDELNEDDEEEDEEDEDMEDGGDINDLFNAEPL